MFFNRKRFFDGVKASIDSTLTQQQVDGLERLLKCMEADRYVTNVPLVAYTLATVMRETAYTFTPIHEYGGKAYFIKRYGGQTRKGKELGNDTPEEGYDYAGKGDTQVTGEGNYERLEIALPREYPEVIAEFERRTGRKFDLTVGDQPNDKKDPQNMLDPVISYISMAYGMRTGLFTGRKIGTFVGENKRQYVKARTVINGTDHAEEIAENARKFEKILNAALEGDARKVTESFPPLTITPPAPETPSEGQETAPEAPVAEVVVQQVVPEKDTPPSPQDAPPPAEAGLLDDLTAKANAVQNRWVALPTVVTTAIMAAVSWATSTSGIVTLSLIGGGVLVVVVYILLNGGRNAGKEKRALAAKEAEAKRLHELAVEELKVKNAREQRAHETQLALIAAAKDKDANTVRIMPMPIQNTDAPTEPNIDQGVIGDAPEE